jgi:hypothetical protein
LRVVFRAAAKAEYEQAAAWYEKQSPGLGEEFLREMDDVISSAAEYPARSCSLAAADVVTKGHE